ncbi:hypothetical protein [Salipiger abyssi]|uniref:hypothetical protein n=1 Tax=Salipiger abyssi TaxID=1250539 RepID=UPI001A8C682B|nr:hypothetical protein [Salipiger abyssi]MBN9886573.1 hypothetical protein [Salipiger abyssi]
MMIGLITGGFSGWGTSSGGGSTQSSGTSTESEETQAPGASAETPPANSQEPETPPVAASEESTATSARPAPETPAASSSVLVETPESREPASSDARAQAIAAQQAFLSSLIVTQLERGGEEGDLATRMRRGAESYAAAHATAAQSAETARTNVEL